MTDEIRRPAIVRMWVCDNGSMHIELIDGQSGDGMSATVGFIEAVALVNALVPGLHAYANLMAAKPPEGVGLQ